MLVAGAYVTITGGAGAVTGFTPDVTLPWDLRYGTANSPEEVRSRLRWMKQHGTYLVPTLETRECVGTNYPAEFVEKANQVMAAQLQNFRKAVAAGVKIAFGTDIGVCPFGRNGREFNFMVENGMTPMEAIRAATVSAADLLGISARIGSIETGKSADLIAVRGDPLSNVRLLENIRFVMKEGRIYKQD